MKEKPDDIARLLHILDAIKEIESYTAGIRFDDFSFDSKTRFASIKQLEIIGEAAYHISEETKKKNASVPWEKIITLRHILVHEYYGIQSDILWRIIQTDIPVFKNQLLEITG